MFNQEQLNLVKIINEQAVITNCPIYLVGGFVRDELRGVKSSDNDIDLLIEGDAILFAEKVYDLIGGELKKFNDFFTAKILNIPNTKTTKEIDFASTRTEIYPHPGALPVVSLSKIQDDLKRRDFSINAMAIPLNALLAWVENNESKENLLKIVVDHFDGLRDLNGGVIKILRSDSFVDDPTRIFRAARYAVRLNGRLENRTELAAIESIRSGSLATISEQRKLNEIKKVFLEKNFYEIFQLLNKLGVLCRVEIFPAETKKLSLFFEKLQKLNLNSSQDLLFQVSMRYFYQQLEESNRDDIFRRFGFGKSAFKRWKADLNSLSSSPLESLSSEALILKIIAGTTPSTFTTELKNRNLI